MAFKTTFSDSTIMAKIRKKGEDAIGKAMIKAKDDLVARLDSGKSITGTSYKYSESYAKAKKEGGARTPVNWQDTGTLRGSIDFKVEASKNIITGTLGYNETQIEGVSNSEKLKFLIKRFKGMWALSASEIKAIKNLVKREFKR